MSLNEPKAIQKAEMDEDAPGPSTSRDRKSPASPTDSEKSLVSADQSESSGDPSPNTNAAESKLFTIDSLLGKKMGAIDQRRVPVQPKAQHSALMPPGFLNRGFLPGALTPGDFPPGIANPFMAALQGRFPPQSLLQQGLIMPQAVFANPFLMSAATGGAGVAGPVFVPPAERRAQPNPNKPPPVKKYKCDICSKAFSRSNTLITHKRIHTGEKPFKCEHCGRAFRQPGNLTRHRLTHTTVKPYICSQCGKAFNRASNLHTHMRTHSSFRPFLCPYCGKGFHQKIDLKIHVYTHTGESQFRPAILRSIP